MEIEIQGGRTMKGNGDMKGEGGGGDMKGRRGDMKSGVFM